MVFVLPAVSLTQRYKICVHSVLKLIVDPLVYVVPPVHADGVALSRTYFAVAKLKLSAAYHVIVIFAACVALVGVALTVGSVKSTFAGLDV